MKDVLKIVLAIAIVIVAWKILKGIIGLAIGIALAGLIFAMLIVSVLWLITRFLPGGDVPPPTGRS